MKKFLSVVLTMVLVLSLASVSVFAADDGKITIRNATVGETYKIYKVFDLTYQKVAATETEEAKTLVSYTYTKSADSDPLFDALASTPEEKDESGTVTKEAYVTPFILTEDSTNPRTYYVELNDAYFASGATEDAKGKAIGEFLQKLATPKDESTPALLTTTIESKTATSNSVEFKDLAYGYYYVESSLGTVVTVDSTLKEVTVVDKNQGPSWDNNPEDPDNPDAPGEGDEPNPGKVIVLADGSRVTENTVNYGETVTFNISVNAKAWVGEKLATYYYITDTLGKGFTLNEDSITVNVYKVGTDEKYVTTATPLAEDTDYTITVSGNTFDITVPFGEKFGSEAKIEVVYTATVNADGEDVVIGGDGNPNTANFTYSLYNVDPDEPQIPTDPSDEPGTGEPEYPQPDNPKNPTDPTDPDNEGAVPYNESNKRTTKTFVYAISIEKVDQDGKPLAGAQFSVKDSAKNSIYGVSTGVVGEYEYALSTAEGAVSTFSTDANGYLVIKGLEEGVYTITEEVAPSGYNGLTETVDIEAACISENSTTETTTYYYDAEGNLIIEESTVENEDNFNNVPTYKLTIENKAGFELPSTGGIGTKIFYALGGLLVAAAGIMLITKKRMASDN